MVWMLSAINSLAVGQSVITDVLLAQTDLIQSLQNRLVSTSDTARVNTLNELSRLYRYSSPDTSLFYARQAERLADSIQYHKGIATALLFTGLVYENQGRYDLALLHLFKSLQYAEKYQDEESIASCQNLLGIVYKAQGKYEQALHHMNIALRLYQKYSHRERIAVLWANIGSVYQAQGRDSAALEILERSAAVYRELNNPNIFWAWLNIGLVYQHKQQYDKAVHYYIEALPICRQLRNTRFETVLLLNIGFCLGKQRKFTKALEFTHQAIDLALTNTFRNELKNAYKVLADVYYEMSSYYEAFDYYTLYDKLKDSILSAEMQRNIVDLQIRMETLQKEQEIKHLSTVRNYLLVGVVVMVVIVFLFINRYRQKQRSEKALRTLNAEITRQQRIVEEQATEIELSNTELQQYNQMLAQKNQELASLNIEKNEFLGIVAHDLKNPLSNMRLLVKLLHEQATTLSVAEIQEFSGDMRLLTEQMFTLITNLLDVNAIEEGRMNIQNALFDLIDILETVVKQYRARAEEKHLTLHIEYPDLALVVYADQNFCREIFDNLLSNAIKYSPPGKHIFLRAMSVPPDDGSEITEIIRVEIQDEGPGLSEEDQQRLFHKFARLSPQPTGGEHSTGLGLSIVKKMVETMRGRVWCKSMLHQGSTFVVEFPGGVISDKI